MTIAMAGSVVSNRPTLQPVKLKTEESITVSAFVETLAQNKMNRIVID